MEPLNAAVFLVGLRLPSLSWVASLSNSYTVRKTDV